MIGLPDLSEAMARLDATEANMVELVGLLKETNDLLREQNEILRGGD